MSWSRSLRAFWLVLLLSCGSTARVAALDMLVGGIQVNESDPDAWMKALDRSGLDTVAVTVYARQRAWDSDDLTFDERDEKILAEIRAARRHRKHVALILRVELDPDQGHNAFLWHGMIQPRTEEQLASWFAKYRRFVSIWAGIAEAEGVDLLGLASELNALGSTVPVEEIPGLEAWYLDEAKQAKERARVLSHGGGLAAEDFAERESGEYGSLADFVDARTVAQAAWARQVAYVDSEDPVKAINRRRQLLDSHWRELIAATKAIYFGPLTFAANFDQYQEVGFWSDLDVLGVNAYFPLRDPGPTDDLYLALRQGWARVVDELERFRRDQGLLEKPLVFTELGYTWRDDSTVEPWNGFGFSLLGEGGEPSRLVVWKRQRRNLEERAQAVRALHDELQSRRVGWFRGFLWWKLSTLQAHEEVEPFVVILQSSGEDPVVEQFRRFLHPWWRAVARRSPPGDPDD